MEIETAVKPISRCLIVSYSYSGNTHEVARTLARLTGGDWHEVFPWQPYPAAFPELLDMVQKQVARQYHPRLLTLSPAPQRYSLIFAGSPNWCGTMAPPLASWLSRNDMSGKIILPFYSHCGGTPCDLQKDIRKLCPKADVRHPLGVIANGGSGLKATLLQWISENSLQSENKVNLYK